MDNRLEISIAKLIFDINETNIMERFNFIFAVIVVNEYIKQSINNRHNAGTSAMLKSQTKIYL